MGEVLEVVVEVFFQETEIVLLLILTMDIEIQVVLFLDFLEL